MTPKRNDILSFYNEYRRPLLLDGAMGSYLTQKGYDSDKILWQSIHNIQNPKAIKLIHNEYIDAGVDIITTNTFRTNPAAVKKSNIGITNFEFVKRSVELTIESRRDLKLIIAGSNAPAEDCYQTERTLLPLDLEYNHKKHIEMLWNNGVDIILNETFSHWDEIDIVSKFCNENKLPFIISFYFNDELKLLSGEPLLEAIKFVSDFSPIAIGFNCVKIQTFKIFIEHNPMNYKHGFYFNCGCGNVNDGILSGCIEPEVYAKTLKPFINYNTLLIGSCCASTPLHTHKIKELLDEVYRN